MSAENTVIGLIVVPMLAAILALMLRERHAAALTVVAGFVQAWFSSSLAPLVLQQGAIRYAVAGWGAPLGIDLHVDGLSTVMLIVTSVAGVAVTLYAVAYFAPGSDPATASQQTAQARAFWPLWLFLWGALNALFVSGDLFNLYVTLELVTLAGLALIGLKRQTAALVAALRYLFAAIIGSMLYLLGIVLLYSSYATVDWERLGQSVQGDTATTCAAALMLGGLALKTALFPLHFWLPPAHATAPPPVSAVLSGLVIKGSFFLILRLWFYVFPHVVTFQAGHLLAMLGAAAIIWGSLQAIRQRRLKLMVAYSTVAQVGYLFLVFVLAIDETTGLAWQGTICFAFAHVFAKGAMFLSVGALSEAVGSDELDHWRGLAQREPVAVFAFGLAGVSLMGLPPSGGFIGKWLLLDASLQRGQWGVSLVMLLGGVLASIYIFRVVAATFETNAVPDTRPVPMVMSWVPLALALCATVLGLATGWLLQLLDIGAPLPVVREHS
jgi:multicomponent Na+:H+ antiporter subunit D